MPLTPIHPHPLVELAVDSSPSRALTSVNVRRDDKVVFELLVAFYSLQLGRPVRHWEAFTMLVADVVEARDEELRRAGLR